MDSDEEYERRRGRDKFRRERNDYSERGREDRRREAWDEKGETWSHRRHESERSRDPYGRDYQRIRRERYSPQRRDISPPQKRMRRDWDDSAGSYGGHYDMHYAAQQHLHPAWGHDTRSEIREHRETRDVAGLSSHGQPQYGQPSRPDVDYPTMPLMMSFKQFLTQQDDGISDEEAVKKYSEYKLEFKRHQINEFFLAHKEEEWFKFKYHPEECDRRVEEVRVALKNRLKVFLELMEGDWLGNISLDADKTSEIVKYLDAVVIKLEGGTDLDLDILDHPELEQELEAAEKEKEKERRRSRNDSETAPPKKKAKSGSESGEDVSDDDGEVEEEGESKEKPEGKKETIVKTKNHKRVKNPKKRHRDKTEYSYDSGSGSASDSGSESESEPAPPGLEDQVKEAEEEKKPEKNSDAEEADEDEEGGEEKKEENQDEEKDDEKKTNGDEEEKKEEKKEEEADEEEKEKDTAQPEEPPAPTPRALHKTCSIFLRNLAPSITKQEVEAMCRRYPGFVRVALQDPQPERCFMRRGWVTFDRKVNIKDICWNLNNIRLRDCEMGAIVNRELKQRVRPVSGVAQFKQIIKSDIKNAAKIITNLDKKWNLWEDEEKEDTGKETFGLVSKNPVLKNITDYLVEEGDYEEEELLGQTIEEKPKEADPELTLERDEQLIKVLDRLVLYLRVIHSVDYYSCSEYQNEDEMPHRCGIIHARGPTSSTQYKQSEVNDWLASFGHKIRQLLEHKDKLETDEAMKLGLKDTEAEVEKFVTANTQELAKDKWLCPLSGKKFKGPDFVRKHIFNKHGEKIEEVKKEVTYFNNYLLDIKRPTLPDHPVNRAQISAPKSEPYPSGAAPSHYGNMSQQPAPAYGQPPQMMYSSTATKYKDRYGTAGGYGNTQYTASSRDTREPYRERIHRRGQSFPSARPNRLANNNKKSRQDPRSLIEYRDLDAPDEMDIF